MTVVLELQSALRADLKDPFGPVSTDTAAVLDAAGDPLVTVGDIVTYHTLDAGRVPDLAFVDERTERAAVDDEVSAGIEDDRFDRVRAIENPPGTLTAALLEALVDALAAGERTLVRVDGEEDLAALPAIAAAPDGASVCYGQPGEGVVHVTVDTDTRDRVVDLLGRMDGDPSRAFDALGLDR
ncbi:GTP-dependent dephospho-CoA kinase family protein [Halosimplex pelagicum]|uniref:GTP-dependent dephospho-CoA kinase n=1 Tax=Halosimplex pelagicum TaxID=869886 RepID=A0A7D5P4D1_9EURY|nr:GTP-dependent dephospho-CoA kinase family protein [Halosimplex pelagicum]QLH80603.1 GTP-dependent dephospho-CoA kinase family protein [Halosimplex pelagicum]